MMQCLNCEAEIEITSSLPIVTCPKCGYRMMVEYVATWNTGYAYYTHDWILMHIPRTYIDKDSI
jgi:DNA-directed RNA polymerase subunit RPC12/RpoP